MTVMEYLQYEKTNEDVIRELAEEKKVIKATKESLEVNKETLPSVKQMIITYQKKMKHIDKQINSLKKSAAVSGAQGG